MVRHENVAVAALFLAFDETDFVAGSSVAVGYRPASASCPVRQSSCPVPRRGFWSPDLRFRSMSTRPVSFPGHRGHRGDILFETVTRNWRSYKGLRHANTMQEATIAQRRR